MSRIEERPSEEWPTRVERPAQLLPEHTDALPPIAAPPDLPPDEPPPSRRFAVGMLAGIALVALVAAALAAAWLLTRDDANARGRQASTQAPTATAGPARTTVPRVLGYKETRALVVLGEARLKPKVVHRPTKKPSGVVVSQKPTEGTEVDRGDPVTIVVDSGAPPVAVPNVKGKPFAEARAALAAAGLKPRRLPVDSDQDPGTVVDQSPLPDAKIPKGTAVTLSVARAAPVAVPDVVGRRAADAEGALRTAGLRARAQPVPSSAPKDTVVAQSPAAGAEARQGSFVRINVSSGAGGGGAGPATSPAKGPATMPDVVGLPQTAAAEALQRAGLLPSVVYVPSDRPANTVVAQAKQPGTELKRGSHVQLNVSRGANAETDATVPDVLGEDEATAQQTLEGAGFTVQVLDQATSDPSEDGMVVDEQPRGTRRAPSGSQVTIFVGRVQPG